MSLSKNCNEQKECKNKDLIMQSNDITKYILELFIFSSILSLLVYHLSGQNHTYTNILFTFPILLILFLILLFKIKTIFLIPEIKILGIFLLWIFFVYIIYMPANTDLLNSSVRFLSLLLQILIYFISFKYFYHFSKGLYQIMLYTALSTTFFLIISNLLNPNINIFDVIRGITRYGGISGSNSHGIISALAIISLTALLPNKKNTLKNFLKIFFIGYAFFNLLITGSRLSLFIIFAYIMIYFFELKYILIVIFIIVGIGMLISINVYIGSNLLKIVFNGIYQLFPYLRLSDYSIIGRITPFIWWFEKAKHNFFMPYGLGEIIKGIEIPPLDGSYLDLLIELGLPGLILIIVFIVLIVQHGNQTLNMIIKQNDEYENYSFIKISLAAFIAIALHGIGETYIFVGIQLGNILFWIIAANLSANYYKVRLKNNRYLKSENMNYYIEKLNE